MSERKRDNRRNWPLNHSVLQLIITTLMTVVLVGVLLFWVKPKTILQLFRTSDLQLILWALVLYVIVYILRVVRYRHFQELTHISLGKFLPIVSLHSFFTAILPFRSGELTFIYLLQKYHGTEIGTGVGALLLVRMYDLIALALCLIGGLIPLIISKHVDVTWLIFFTFTFGLIILVFSLTAASWWKFTVNIVNRVLRRIGVSERKWVKTVSNWATEVGNVLENSTNLFLSIRLLLTSILVWSVLFSMFWVLLRSMGISDIAYHEVIVATTGAALTSALPVNLIGGLGTMELGWMAGFSVVGVAITEAVTTGFALHIWVLLFSMFLATGSYLWFTIGSAGLRGSSDQR